MHTNDTHANLDNIGRKTTAIKEFRAKNPNSLLLDAGDVFSGTLYFNEYKGLADLEFMNWLGYDAMTFGNHEFDLGTEALANFVKEAEFPFVSTNVDFSADANLKAFYHKNVEVTSTPADGNIYNAIIKVVNGEKIGIFGLTTAETVSISSPGNDVAFQNYIQEAQKSVDALKAQGVNKIIALTHIGYNDGGGDNDLLLAKAVEGIDIIVGGHSHSLLLEPVIDTTGEEPTVIVQANEYNKYLGTLDVQFDSYGKVIGHARNLIQIDGKTSTAPDAPYVFQSDAEAVTKLAPYKAQVDEKQATIVGKSSVQLVGGNPAARTGETNLGNLIADGMLAKAKTINPDTVIALQNGGGVRDTLAAGDITLADIFKVLPFGNALGIMTLKGSEIKAALEHGVKDAPTASGGFLQVSGLKFTYDTSKPLNEKVLTVQVQDKNGNYSQLDLQKDYVVATNIFTAKGGDGFVVFKKAYDEGRVSEPGFVDWEILRDYIEAQPNKTVNPSVEGRIVKVTTPAQ
ncbi:bifunctional UDP-sugar hydrolase/5'-nucleotidase [Bacillus sp. FJAT-27445]|uniref:bifunctional metallophosphatase/5'-nucleotidase n=1 Tax=Bacillus sp. FJAT-27445 TaxID=1679166 RepID=UPI0009E68533|nr:5'-nucleotidase C-terminal domain-containing protein [Bacillus sp. FJAT-27445]